MGGLDIPENTMLLTRREHAIAHLILHKLYGYNEDLWAANMLMKGGVDMSGDNNPMRRPEVAEKLRKPKPPRTQKHKDNIGRAMKTAALGNQNAKGKNLGNQNAAGQMSDDHKKKISESITKYWAEKKKLDK